VEVADTLEVRDSTNVMPDGAFDPKRTFVVSKERSDAGIVLFSCQALRSCTVSPSY
jgi:hypothetical protein